MPNTFGFKWDDHGCRAALSRLDKDVDWATRNALKSSAAAISKEEKKRAPVLTGTLKRSIRQSKVKRDTSMGIVANAYKVAVGPMPGKGIPDAIRRYRSVQAERTGFTRDGYAAAGAIVTEKFRAAYTKTMIKLGH